MIGTIGFFGLLIMVAFFVIVITDHQEAQQLEIETSLADSATLNELYLKELTAAELVVEHAAAYVNHQDEGNYANEVSVPLSNSFETNEMAFVSNLNYILGTKDVHSFINLFKQEEFNAWLAAQNITVEPEGIIYSYMQECMAGIQAFQYYQTAGEHYLRIHLKDGQMKHTQLAVVPELDTLRFSLSLEEFKDYIRVS